MTARIWTEPPVCRVAVGGGGGESVSVGSSVAVGVLVAVGNRTVVEVGVSVGVGVREAVRVGNGVEVGTLAELASQPAVVQAVRSEVEALNRRFSQAEGIRRFVLLGEEWQPDSDELTPTMKLKRRGVLRHYGPQIEGLYEGGGVSVDDDGAREFADQGATAIR